MKRLFFLACISFLFLTCNNRSDGRSERVLNLARENREELEKVLAYYAGDTLKYQAAEFLIENMLPHFYFSDNESLYSILDSLNLSTLHRDSIYPVADSLYKKLRKRDEKILEYDIKTLQAEFLIGHIDASFDSWQNGPFKEQVAFDEFCRYILPYSVSTEKREPWVDFYRERYSHYLQQYMDTASSPDKFEFSEWLNARLIEDDRMILQPEVASNYPPVWADHIRKGSCFTYSVRAIYIMRSLGLPVALGYAPHWENYRYPHVWNVLHDDERLFPFNGFDVLNEYWEVRPGFRYPKMYHRTYEIQKDNLAAQRIKEMIPPAMHFNFPFFQDVTELYFPVSDINIKISKNKNIDSQLAYLCLFTSPEWRPVEWSRVSGNNKVSFKKMGRGIVYMPARYANYDLIPAGPPFALDTLGRITMLEPDEERRQQIEIFRKYPENRLILSHFPHRMQGGKFQGSNTPDFKKCEDLFTINYLPRVAYDTVNTQSAKAYRYVRYLAPEGSYGNVAEIELYTDMGDSLLLLTGKVLNMPEKNIIAEGMADAAFDDDPLTYFECNTEEECWTGLDLGTPQVVDKITFMCRCDDNAIRIGDEYELFYWKDGKWVSLGEQTARQRSLKYDDVPTNALFWLRNYTRGDEERIFTYENGRQVWW